MTDDDTTLSDGAIPTRRLHVGDVDLDALAMAMGQNEGYIAWLFDPATGEVVAEPESTGDEDEDLDEDELLHIGSEGSHEAYRDMERFAYFVGDKALAGRLERALEGRGAFRRFKDELYSMPEMYREKWYEYSNVREQERAIEWLQDRDAVERDDADREIAERQRAAAAILDAIEAQGGIRVDVVAAPDRWSEIVAAVDRGTPVTLTRDGELFAVISREQ